MNKIFVTVEDEKRRMLDRCMPEPNSGCWLWTLYLNQKGYGTVKVGSLKDGTRRQEMAHRWMWQLFRGPIPKNLEVCHKCDTGACINPDHLFLGTHADNMWDKSYKQRDGSPKGEQHPWAKLTEEQVIEIFHYPASLRKTGKKFNISSSVVWRIRQGWLWKELTHALLIEKFQNERLLRRQRDTTH